MYFFYIVALLFFLGSLIAYFFQKRFAWWECLIGGATAFVLAGIFHALAIRGVTSDKETWSGQITHARYFTAWKEYYEYAVYRTETIHQTCSGTDSQGNSYSYDCSYTIQVFDHWEPATRWHSEYWRCYSTIDTEYNIGLEEFNYYVKVFNDKTTVSGDRTTSAHNSRMIDGNPNDYVANNTTGWIQPVTKLVSFENRVKAAPSVFSFTKVSTNIPVYEYPANKDPFNSDRLLGTARNKIDLLKFDQMNSRLGAAKKVNVILIGFHNQDSMIAQYQRAKFVGGKKNDLVLCYGESQESVNWSFVFGWTDKELVKQNLQTIVLQNSIDNELLPLIEAEIRANYTIKNWKDFDYLTIEPPTWAYWVFFIVIILVQGGLYCFFWHNEIDKERYYIAGSDVNL